MVRCEHIPIIFTGVACTLLASCFGGTYRPAQVNLPIISKHAKYAKLNGIHFESKKTVNPKELKKFEQAVFAALEERGIKQTSNPALPGLYINVQSLFEEPAAIKGAKLLVELSVGGPWVNNSLNSICVRVEVRQHGQVIQQFDEFEEYRENMRDWKGMQQMVANRIADAVYFAH